MKLARVAPCLLNPGFVRALWRCRIQRTLLFHSLVRPGYNYRWCELYGLGVSRVCNLRVWSNETSWRTDWGKLTSHEYIKAKNSQKSTYEKLKAMILYKMLDKYEIAKSRSIFLDTIPWKVDRKLKKCCDLMLYL